MKAKICEHALNMLFDRADTKFVKRNIFGHYIFTADEVNYDACKIVGNRIIWRVQKADFLKKRFLGIAKRGRWRDLPRDEIITFKILNDYVEITMQENETKTRKIFKIL